MTLITTRGGTRRKREVLSGAVSMTVTPQD